MSQHNTSTGSVVIANRNSGSISILNEDTGELIRTVDLPSSEGESTPEPMYVYNLISTNEIIVDDRANNRVVFFDSETFEVTGTVETGAGNFHMWASPQEDRVWVVNDRDDTLTVIDPQTKTEITRVELPEEVIGADALPHDVIIDPSGDFAYVTVIRENNPDSDLLVKIDARDFTILDTADVGKDPHVSLSPENNLLYVPAAESDRIEVFDRRGTELVQVDTIEQPGAHGIEFTANGKYIYTTNLPGGGDNGLFAIDSVSNEIVGDLDGVDTPFAVPHNVWLTGDGEKLFLTHSGGESSQVSFYSLEDPTLPVLEGSTDVEGLNPFGLAYAAPDVDDLIVGTENRDRLRGREGNDFLYGEAGNDRLIGNRGNDKLFGGEGADQLRGNEGDDVLIGGEGRDLLIGNRGDDLLVGVSVESFTPGANEIDFLIGNSGADTFVLGDALEVYYDDDNDQTLGLKNFANIRDFDLQESDVIRLHGSADDYSLESSSLGTSIFYESEGQSSELIGVVAGVNDLQLDSDAFEFASV
ncbi:Type I secretion target GGXGXDXXX repeat protein domain protein [Hyella patelloides LEGE 07179]|uniref:Type I secretion target GGXGXDXXX repeat protein domain protein n=1 Tax=Hyella patelloides LEGE 07179 TaxID=945734 RepID=A0A563VQ57_9CYAN|nr:beta-propeller fold lactonase family protein [Hyella patelloides]VEP13540.1 Type I secretion target GGXGXDXXX repeat protein domain protein [Hyella patelloides LEGE 07179]